MDPLHAVVNLAMREVPRLNPENPALHFIQMLEDAGYSVIKKVEAILMPAAASPLQMAVAQMAAAPALQASINATAERLIAEAKAKRPPSKP